MFDILFPSYCINCKKNGEYICEKCFKLFKNTLPECYLCRKLSTDYTTHNTCNKHNIEKCFVAWEYNDIAKEILSQYKFKYAYKLASIIGKNLIERLQKSNFDKNISKDSILVPIPIHKQHENDRGFNQSSLIGEILAEHFNCKIDKEILYRVGDSSYQSQKGFKERLEFDKNNFRINKIIKDKNIILIDDVISTGTTINCAGDLLNNNNVYAIGIFRGKPHYHYLR